jgi:hypothetical protein
VIITLPFRWGCLLVSKFQGALLGLLTTAAVGDAITSSLMVVTATTLVFGSQGWFLCSVVSCNPKVRHGESEK